ncbi:MAG: hypothetical protein R3B48_28250 [Kofleriaceae bacterium]
MERPEARILTTNNLLIALGETDSASLRQDFCGSVIEDLTQGLPDLSGKTVYLCGDLSKASGLALDDAQRVFVIRELSRGGNDVRARWSPVGLGRAPLRVHGVGVYYRRFFDPDGDYFARLSSEHTFQALTESTKPSKAHRTGLYLTPVERDAEGLHFRLLRCSTNLSGPTENFSTTDHAIVDALNQEASVIFQDQAPLNHVLAQIYHNTPASETQRQAKAKISAHADKTKDMPGNGLMAFCTFYDGLEKLQPLTDDAFDYGDNGVSGLTRLEFHLKDAAADEAGGTLPQRFTVTLYPDSVFFMPLSTNRLYTHEIRSAALDAEQLPTRLGYVVRCSSAEAVHVEGQTYLKRGRELVKLAPPTDEELQELRALYAQENKSAAPMDYGSGHDFSMNEGDYLAPRLRTD